MARRDNFRLNFDDTGQTFRDPSGNQGVRNFHDPRHGFGGSRSPLYGNAAVAPAAGASAPVIITAIIATVVVVGLIVGIPLAIIFGIVLPNSTTESTTPAQGPTVVVPVRTSRPDITDPVTVPRRPGTLVVICPSDIREGTATGQNYAVVSWDQPRVVSQNSGQAVLRSNLLPSSRFPIGDRDVVYTATIGDDVGTCTFTVTVYDDDPPSIQCPSDIVVPTDPLSNSASVTWPEPTIVENTGVVTMERMTDESGDHFHIGMHTVTIVIHDEANNEARCSFTILVEDKEDPRLTCPSDRLAYTNAPVSGSIGVTWANPIVRDNSLGPARPSVCTPASGSPFMPGTTSVTCTATDAAGNDGDCTFNVIVRYNDTGAPVFDSCPSNIVQNATMDSDTSIVNWVGPTATDNSLETPTISVNMDPNQEFTIGTYKIVYTARDGNGNTAKCMFTVEVVDSQDPTITCPDDVSQNTDDGQPDATVTLPAATTNDNSVTPLTTTTDPPGSPVLSIGSHNVTYTVTDESGNSAACDIIVTVIDEEPPKITCLPSYTIRANEGQSSANINLPDPASLTDNSEGVVAITTSPANNSNFVIGSYNVTYTATDPSGNTAMCDLPVTVVDSETPDLACPDDIMRDAVDGLHTAMVTFTAIVVDNAGLLTAVPDRASGSAFSIGATLVTFTATDGSGNTATCNFTVTIEDDQDPAIMCPADIRQNTDDRQPNTRVTLPAATTSDNSVTPLTTTTDPPGSPILSIGSHIVTYTVTDESSNSAACNLTVTIVDEEPPSVTAPSDFEVTTDGGESFATVSLPYPSGVTDNSRGVVQVTTSPGNDSRLDIGSNDVIYNVTDPSGNFVIFTVTVTVLDEEPPFLICPDDITRFTESLQSYADVTVMPQNLTDNDGYTPTLMSDHTGSLYDLGSTVVQLTATDKSDNEVMCSFTVTVQDDEDPAIMCPADIRQLTDVGQPNTTVTLPAATTSDNSVTPLTSTTDPPGSPILSIGSHTVTYTVTDESDNSAACNLTVTIVDEEPPSVTAPPDFEVTTDGGESFATVSLPDPSGVTDNSRGVVQVTTSPGNNSRLDIGSNDVIYNVTDPSGNTVTFTVTVTVLDEEPPFLICPDDITSVTESLQSFANVTVVPQNLTDNDGYTPTLMSNHTGSLYDLGSTVVQLTATDKSDNEVMCSFTVTVQDDEDPAIMCPADIRQITDVGQPNTTVTLPAATTSDNSETPLTSTTDPPGSPILSIGSHTVTYTVSDESGNSAACNLTVTIVDEEPPSATAPSDFEVTTDGGESFATVSLPYPSGVTDNSRGVVQVTTSPGNNSRLDIGSNDVIYNVTDPSGNFVIFTVTVTVLDEEPPFLICPDDITSATESLQSFANVTVVPQNLTDNDGYTPTLMSNHTGSLYDLGSTVVELTATDKFGNEVMCSFTITVQDDEDPAIMCPADIRQLTDVGQPNTTVTLPAATTSDNSEPPLTSTTDPSGSPVLSIGSHIVTYTVTDESGNSAACNLTVTIVDEEPPNATAPSDFEVTTDGGESFATVSLPDPSGVTDNSGGVVQVTTSPGNNSRLDIGSNDVIYNVTDPSGNTVTFTVIVTVRDEERPLLICPADFTSVTESLLSYANVTVVPQNLTDNDGYTPTLMSNHTGSLYDLGSTTVQLTAADKAGNENTCSFTIIVKDEEPPMLECPSSVSVYSNDISIPLTFSAVATWSMVNITDNSGLPLMSNESTHESGSVFDNPSTTVTYTAVDAYNNSNQCSFVVKVIGFTNTECESAGVDIDLSVLTGTGVNYHLLSEKYDIGQPYTSGKTCLWRVSAPNGTYINLAVAAFSTELDSDKLYIGSGLQDSLEETSLASYDGTLPSGAGNAKGGIFGDTIWLRFESDSSTVQPGFLLLLDFTSDPRDLYPDSYSVCPDYGGFPCLDGTCINMSKRCDGNADCPTNNEDELDCPASNCPQPIMLENVNFTDPDGVVHADIVSKNYPGEYPPCTTHWNINPDNVVSVRIVVMDLQLDARDRLFVVDEDGLQVTPDIVSPISMHVNTSNITLVFESGGGIGRGFWIRVWRYTVIITNFVDFPAYCKLALHNVQCGGGECMETRNRCDLNKDCVRFGNDELNCELGGTPDCGVTSISLGDQGSTYHLTSVNYPGDYYIDHTCQYFVTTTATTILVSFRDVEVIALPPVDYLRIGNGATVTDGSLIIRVEGYFLPADVESTGKQLWIEFKSGDFRATGRGFWITLLSKG